MITVTIIGLDPYMVRGISKDLTPKIADICELTKDDINFYVPECLYIHDGVEQNSWNILVKVNAPKKVSVMEEEIKDILHHYLKEACVNMSIEFYYYSQDNRYEFIRDDHPRFMEEKSLVFEEDYDEDDEEEDLIELYLGNVFKDIEDKID